MYSSGCSVLLPVSLYNSIRGGSVRPGGLHAKLCHALGNGNVMNEDVTKRENSEEREIKLNSNMYSSLFTINGSMKFEKKKKEKERKQ